MCDKVPIASPDAPEIASVRPWAKVLLVWGVLAVLFAVFNILYWPVYRKEALTHPEAFVDYAGTLPPGEARQVVKQGLEQFNPPWDIPYLRLAELERQAGNMGSAAALEARAAFYRLLQQDPVPAEGLAALAHTARTGSVAVQVTEVVEGLSRATSSLAAAFGLGADLNSWAPEAQLAIFTLGGSVFSTDGTIGGTGVRAPMPLLVYSGGGMDQRRGAHILVGPADHAARQRGMHIVLLTPDTGAVLRADRFDLWESTFEAERMLHFLTNAPEGCIGLFAVCDDGSAFMTSVVEEGLVRFGLGRRARVGREPRILGLRFSFAAVGVKGAPPDSALQAWSPDQFKGHRGHPVLCAVFNAGGPS